MSAHMITRSVSVAAATVPYRLCGSGPALVLVHGTGRGSVTWDALLERLTGRHTVVLPDLSGSDRAVDDGSPLTIEGLAAQVAAVIEDAGTGPADVVGHSLGASVALALAATRPDLVRRLIPVAGWTGGEDAYVAHVIEQYLALADRPEAFARHAMLTGFSRRHIAAIGPAAADELARGFTPSPGRVRQLELVRRLSMDGMLARVTAPTLVIGCAEDALIPVANSRRIHAAIPGGDYAELDSGHVVRVERPAELVALIEEFLGR
ncbi:alpha/beta fold hydrolase [Actinorhabdospora filicis]|nr:alpha/beta hydrolase [Actinorhabdospora filicis]